MSLYCSQSLLCLLNTMPSDISVVWPKKIVWLWQKKNPLGWRWRGRKMAIVSLSQTPDFHWVVNTLHKNKITRPRDEMFSRIFDIIVALFSYSNDDALCGCCVTWVSPLSLAYWSDGLRLFIAGVDGAVPRGGQAGAGPHRRRRRGVKRLVHGNRPSLPSFFLSLSGAGERSAGIHPNGVGDPPPPPPVWDGGVGHRRWLTPIRCTP